MAVYAVEGESKILPARGLGGLSAKDDEPTRSSQHALVVAGVHRGYLLIEPVRPDLSIRYPLIVVLHGDGGTMMSFHDGYPFEHASGAEAFVVYPDGLRATWDLESTIDNRDVQFVAALIDDLASRLPVARDSVFATGYSSGGFLSNVLACQKPGLLRAIASNAGGAPYNQRQTWSNGFPKCPGQAPVAMLALHGEQDYGVTLDSGRFSAAYWAYVNGCSTGSMETTGYTQCHVYRGCPAGKAVGFCSIPGLGHWVWDQAAVATWTFFKTQRT